MITEPVPVSPHDTPKPRRSRQSARSLIRVGAHTITATDGRNSFPGRWSGLALPVPSRIALAAVSFLLARRFRCSGRRRPCAPGRLAIEHGGAVRARRRHVSWLG